MSGRIPPSNETNIGNIVSAVRDLFMGRSNAYGTFTLTANVGSTAVTAANCGVSSQIFWSPKTAHASAEVGAGTIYLSAVAAGTFTVTHANNAQTDRIFAYEIVG